jgi:hypothetical protein
MVVSLCRKAENMMARSAEEVNAIIEKYQDRFKMEAHPLMVMTQDGNLEGWIVPAIQIYRNFGGTWMPLEFDWNPKDTIHATRDDADKHARAHVADWLVMHDEHSPLR